MDKWLNLTPPAKKAKTSTIDSSEMKNTIAKQKYEMKRGREYQRKWEIGRPWLYQEDFFYLWPNTSKSLFGQEKFHSGK